MVKITDVTKNEESIIVVWSNAIGEYITFFEPNITPQEVRVKLTQLSEGFEIPEAIMNLKGSEF